MKKIKKIIFCVLLIILIVIIIIIIINKKNTNNNNIKESNYIEDLDNIKVDTDKTLLQRVSNRNDYYVAKKCLEKFYMSYAEIFNEENTNTNQKQEYINSVYNILDSDYINYKKITNNNIEQKLEKIDRNSVNITDMYVVQKNSYMYAYFVYGNIIDKTTNNMQPISIIIKADLSNGTYKILLSDYVNEKYNNIKIGDSVNIYIPEKIENNKYNTFIYESISDSTYIKDMFDNYLENMLYNTKVAYDMLNQDYKERKFGSIDAFNRYIAQNKDKIERTYKEGTYNNSDFKTLKEYNDFMFQNSNLGIKNYLINKDENYTQYIGIDNYNNYFIFNATAPMKYEVMLDGYTINTLQTTEKYNLASDSNKIAMNIEKIREAINNKDYKYVYSKLYDIFKTNNFPTEDSLKKYLLANLFENNKFEYSNVDEQNGTYIFTINVTDATGTDSTTKKLNMIMKLEEGTDFVMSFSMQ